MPASGLLIFSSFLFAVMAVLVRVLDGALSPGQVVVVRFVVGAVCTLGLFAYQKKKPKMLRWRMLALRGVLGGAAVYSYFFAIEELGVGPATLLNYSAPVYAAIFSGIFLKEKLTPRLAVGMLIATAGAILVAWSTAPIDRPFALGIGAIVGLLSAVFSGAAMTSIRALRQDTDAPTVFFSFCVMGALVGMPFAVSDFRLPTTSGIALGVVIGIISFVAQILFTQAFAFVTASLGSATMQLTPVFSWGMAVLFLDEPVRPWTVVGAVVCMVGVLLGITEPASREPETV